MEMALAMRPEADALDPVDRSLVGGKPPPAVPSPKGIGVREVAHLAKVSPATVSLVINDNPRISLSTQKRVRKAIEQLGYRPNRVAGNAARRSVQTLAIMLPSLSHAFADRYFGELISGICDRAGALEFKVMLEQATPKLLKERRHLELFDRRAVDGVLCLGNSDRHSFLADFAAANHPMIAVNSYFPQWDLDHVVCDYRGGAGQAMNYLLQLGHRHIGLIMGSTWVRTARDVVEIYEQKLREAGIEPLTTLREDGLFTEEGGAEGARRLMHRHPELTAILAGNDKMALGAMHHISECGKRVPQDISVVGFDDMQQAAYANPALTTVHLPLYEVGVLACEKLVARVQGRTDRVKSVLATHLVVRHSSGIVRETT